MSSTHRSVAHVTGTIMRPATMIGVPRRLAGPSEICRTIASSSSTRSRIHPQHHHSHQISRSINSDQGYSATPRARYGLLTASPRHKTSLASSSMRPSGMSTSRSFFSLPDISRMAKMASAAVSAVGGEGSTREAGGGVEMDGNRQTYHARKILPYSQKQLYQLVADVPSYSSFIPFCNSSAVLQSPPDSSSSPSSSPPRVSANEHTGWTPPSGERFEVDAELRVGFGGFAEAYTSRVVGEPYESVSATAVKAPLFKSLKSTWSFSPASTFSPHPSNTIPSLSPSTPSSSSTSNGKAAEGDRDPALRQPNDPSPGAATDPSVGPTLLTIDLAFEFSNPLHRIASQAVLPQVAGRMVEAFEKRCLEVWGPGKD